MQRAQKRGHFSSVERDHRTDTQQPNIKFDIHGEKFESLHASSALPLKITHYTSECEELFFLANLFAIHDEL